MPFQSLYIHVPFCIDRKCDYCAFYSETCTETADHAQYLERLRHELEAQADSCAPLRSIFIGGGTPTALSARELGEIGRCVRECCTLAPDCEWSMEANPESATEEKLEAALAAGINRFSFGVQSFSPGLRAIIGRHGDISRLPSILDFLHKAGATRVNLDLIFAIPGETPDDWRMDLEQALSYSPPHLSCYSLITEENTPFGRRQSAFPQVPEEDFLKEWEITDQLTRQAGLQRYEISNFAAGKENYCRHNWEIWHGQTYLGIGPAAVSFDGTDRFSNPPSLQRWLEGEAPEFDLVPPEVRQREIFAFAFRTVEGWTWRELHQKTALTPEKILAMPEIQALMAIALLENDASGIRPTQKGLLLNDDILENIIG